MEVLRAASARHGLRRHVAALQPRNWVCRSCQSQSRSRSQSSLISKRQFASSSPRLQALSSTPEPSPVKPYYVTTPIFYVNAAPHVGHMYSMVLADVLKRWQTLAGNKAILCTGTDEHGIKVQQAADLNGLTPKAICDENAEKFKDLAKISGIDYDRFIRTTDPDHVEAVKHFWRMLERQDLIYESTHSGWYCVSDECFYPEGLLERRQDPFTGEVFMASVESGNKVEWTEEKNYHFRMTALRQKLLDFYEANPGWLVPATRQEQVIDWVKNNLEDLSISRPIGRLHWGIRVPDDSQQTIYVWFDALINYITMAGFPDWRPGLESLGGWPADVQVIGKDIVRFHCVYWPALLMALDLPLPKRILSHAHWTMNKTKMSKSIGNVVSPSSAIDRFGLDTIRFYLIHDGGIADDADYSNDGIETRYNTYLCNELGNQLNRVTVAKQWDLPQVVTAMTQGSLEASDGKLGENFENQERMLRGLAANVSEHMNKLNSGAALRGIMQAVGETNKFLTQTEPWFYFKQGTPESLALVNKSIFFAAESLRITGILLQPFMPRKAKELLDRLGVASNKRTLANAELFSDFGYGQDKKPLGQLFPRIELEPEVKKNSSGSKGKNSSKGVKKRPADGAPS
ncbi:putative METHIONYL-TRNA SYNTHETASE, mitochondrial [Bombardia bombarda]|uniref:Probable methionine--tRNA ligase, mitochondrial n=1 Tax=Bombardia bombarda TaxID=252184 RepID=A0AA40CFH0_9PEZI|nr:putative METHIONYL-TRNA SYNTHETASE, mitochondrial [Bombardia bombarda]